MRYRSESVRLENRVVLANQPGLLVVVPIYHQGTQLLGEVEAFRANGSLPMLQTGIQHLKHRVSLRTSISRHAAERQNRYTDRKL